MNASLVAVTGNTYPVKDQLKALGARWNPEAKAWMVAADKADAARRIVAGAPAQSSRFARPSYRRSNYRRDDSNCSCYQCRSGSECLCIYGNG
jgi:hypothetical protein